MAHHHHVTISSMKQHPHHDILRQVLDSVFGSQLQQNNPKRERYTSPGLISLKFKGLSRRMWKLLLMKLEQAFTGLCVFITTEGKRVVNLCFPMPEWQTHPAT